MGSKARNKGKVGEREAAKAVAETLSVDACRGVQFQGSRNSPDIRTSLPGTHFEVKRCERLSVYKAVDQAVLDASKGESVPVVLHRMNNRPWLVVVRLADLPKLATQVYLAKAQP